MPPIIRIATEHDAKQVRAIYAPIVEETAISFETEPPTVADFRQKISTTLERLPWIVCDDEGELQGYAYAGPYRVRVAYQWSVEVSVYVSSRARRKKVGSALYTSLLELLSVQGYVNAYAGITLPNPASVGLHESLGFEPVGIYRSVGYKMGRWHDVGWWQLSIGDHVADPAPPVALDELRTSVDWDRALEKGRVLFEG